MAWRRGKPCGSKRSACPSDCNAWRNWEAHRQNRAVDVPMFSKVGHCFVIAINIGIEFGQPERKGGSLGHINCSDVTTATVNRGISIPKLIFVCLNCCNLLAFVGFATIQASKEFCSNLRPRFEYVAFLSPTYSFLICDDHGLRTCGCWSERSVFGWNCPSA